MSTLKTTSTFKTGDSKTLLTESAPLDPKKRTLYRSGQVLHADALRQDQVHHRERHHLHQRALHGCGPVCGLEVWLREAENGIEVVVEPGLAISPQGQPLQLTTTQGAVLDTWLVTHRDEITLSTTPPSEVASYVVLCYRECPADALPIPSGPCSTIEDTGQPSRLAESPVLELRAQPPAKPEEKAVREFGDLLRRIEIIDGPGGLDREHFAAEVRKLAPGSPEPTAAPLRLHPDDAATFLRLAMRIWSREIRPQIVGDGCSELLPQENCVLLARLVLPIAEAEDGSLKIDGPLEAIQVDEEEPPLLLSTRLLQEWLFHLGGAAARAGVHGELEGLDADDHEHYLLVDGRRALGGDWSAGNHRIRDLAQATRDGDALPHGQEAQGDLRGTYPGPTVRALQTHAVAANPPQNRDSLRWHGGASEWRPGRLDHGDLTGRDDDDHPQYLLADGTRPLTAHWAAGDGRQFRIRDVATATAAGDVLVHGQPARGDLQGRYPNPQVSALRGTPIVGQLNPSEGQALTWNGSAWAPATPTGQAQGEAGGDLHGNYPDPTVVGLRGRELSRKVPKTGEVLTWGGSLWVPRQLPKIDRSPAEKDLTRIVAMSWLHGSSYLPPPRSEDDDAFFSSRETIRQMIFASVSFDGGETYPEQPWHLVVAFGKERPGDGGLAEISGQSLNTHTFHLLVDRFSRWHFTRSRAWIERVIPVKIDELDSHGRITRATETDETLAQGAAIGIIPVQFEDLIRPRNTVQIIIKGDFVLDETGKRAIDAQHLRGERPTGERPRGSEYGTQGGRFESWFAFDAEFPF